MNDYSHLNIEVSKNFLYKIKNKLPLENLPKFYFLIRFLHKFKIIRKVSSKVSELESYRSDNVVATEEVINQTKEKFLNENNFKGNEFESGFGYDEFMEVKGVFHYYEQILNNFEPPHLTESKILYESIINKCSKVIENQNVKNFTNFGSYLSHTDSILAKKFKNTVFHCADRSRYTKKINEFIYENITNMNFIDGDIFNFLKNKFDNSLFFSARTALIMPKTFLDELYQSVYKANYKYIILFEQIGISHETYQSYEFSDTDKPSVAFRWGMYLHNYPGLLKKNGYEVKESKLIKTDHPHEDYRFLYIFAEKV